MVDDLELVGANSQRRNNSNYNGTFLFEIIFIFK